MRGRRWWLVFLTALFWACTIDLGGPEFIAPPITPPPGAADTLRQAWQQAFTAAAQTGRLTVELDEVQLTAWLAERLAQRPDAWFRDPVVFLRDGRMYLYGRVYRDIWTAGVRIVLTAQVDDQGNLRLLIQEADFGPWPVPEGLREGLSALLDEAFTGRVGPFATGVRLEAIHIQDGKMTIEGRLR